LATLLLSLGTLTLLHGLKKIDGPGMIPIAEQASALLSARTFELASKNCDGDLRLLDTHWTITISDLMKYVTEHGIPSGWFRGRPATYDGIYLIQSGTGWSVFEQERGRVLEESRMPFGTYNEALECVLMTYYMPASRRSRETCSDKIPQ